MKCEQRTRGATLLRLLRLVAGATFPLFFFLNYYNNNPQYFIGANCVMFGVLLCAVGALFYYLLSRILDDGLALLVVVLLWSLFWLYPSIATVYPVAVFWMIHLLGIAVIVLVAGAFLHFLHISKRTALVITAMWLLLFLCYPYLQYNYSMHIFWILLACIVIVLARIIKRYPLDNLTKNALATAILVLVMFNLFNAAYIGKESSNNAEKQGILNQKTIFNVNPESEHPNIYWLHMDGMMGFEEIQNLFGDNQNELKHQMKKYGFVINESASLDIGFTSYAIPALTSPDYYDNNIRPLFLDMQDMIHWERQVALSSKNVYYNIYEIYPNLELFTAFRNAKI